MCLEEKITSLPLCSSSIFSQKQSGFEGLKTCKMALRCDATRCTRGISLYINITIKLCKSSLPKQQVIGDCVRQPLAEYSPLQLFTNLQRPFLLSTEHLGPLPSGGHGISSTYKWEESSRKGFCGRNTT